MPSEISRSKHEVVHQRGRSRVTNGRQLFLEKVDQRTGAARRYRDVLALVVSDLGGVGNMSEMEMIVAKRLATLTVHCEQCESDMANTGKLDTESYLPSVGVAKRLIDQLGLKRRPREIGGNVLDTYVKANSSRARKDEPHSIEASAADEPRPARRINEAVAAVAGGGACGSDEPETPRPLAGLVRVHSRKAVERVA